ncbi:MAG: 3-hydroxyacyl-CoA dehydrogenase, partial [Geminicoccaceae bacterium]
VGDYAPPEKFEMALPGASGRVALDMAVDALRLAGKATPHDEVVGKQLAIVLSGGATDLTLTIGDDDLLKLERQAFMTLVRRPATLARIEHMLETGKPLRN